MKNDDFVYIPFDMFFARLSTNNCPCCTGGKKMPTEEELEQMITEQIDNEKGGE